MGWFKGGSYMPAPVISHKPSGQPPAGDARTMYEVLGVWNADGEFEVPTRVVVQVRKEPGEPNRECSYPGEFLSLTRQEAAVVQKHTVLRPVLTKKA